MKKRTRISRKDLVQQRRQHQKELEDLDFQFQKQQKQGRLKKSKVGRFEKAIDDVNRGFQAFGEFGSDSDRSIFKKESKPSIRSVLKKGSRKRTTIKTNFNNETYQRPKALDNPFGGEIGGGSDIDPIFGKQKRLRSASLGVRGKKHRDDSLLGDTSDFGLL